MKKTRELLAAAAIALTSLTVSAPPALAANQTIEQAKAACVIGERNDGYLGVVSGKTASDAQKREMRTVNQQRKAVYERLAARNGVTVDVAARLTAEKLVNQAKPGHCVQNASGGWVKK